MHSIFGLFVGITAPVWCSLCGVMEAQVALMVVYGTP